MIKLIDVKKIYQSGVIALSNINLEIKKGEFVFLVGSTGSGKSTLIKLLYREEIPTSGKVLISGINVSELKESKVPYLRQRIGVVFQDFKLLPNRTVWENVAFTLRILGVGKKEQTKKVKAALELTGLSEYSDFYVNDISGGERQRVAIARSIINTPPILLADEPTGNLDPDNTWEIMRLLTKINAKGTTIIVSTHNKSIVDTMKKRVITMSKGSIIQDQKEGEYSIGTNN
ncbi:MAG: cell division ATP-binding protein FtsE [Candidatus Sericytochromatia bacterium]|nr:MAG: cell division ATP-binding protein FtsE [Candidatus Sericytochromatia bacterium]